MDALILSCSTGGGHNAAGYAVKEELERRGHHVRMLDPYELLGNGMEQTVGRCYVRIAQKAPRLFGLIYQLGELYRKLPFHSPVYLINKKMIPTMQQYLTDNHFDVIIMPHVFPGEILTCMKDKGIAVPKMIFIATDYTCIPFTEEIDCDYYIAPSPRLVRDFTAKGIAPSKVLPLGIPVRRAFRTPPDRADAIARLGLSQDRHYLLLTGGSIGAGKIWLTITLLKEYLKKHPDYVLIVVCGNNHALYHKLHTVYRKNRQIILLQSTKQMADYMRASDVLMSKPGGLTTTEAAVIGIPLIHLAPIPGCENKNMQFFSTHGMSACVGNHTGKLLPVLKQLQGELAANQMIHQQRQEINAHATEDICNLAEKLCH